jgi:hypothetical protein
MGFDWYHRSGKEPWQLSLCDEHGALLVSEFGFERGRLRRFHDAGAAERCVICNHTTSLDDVRACRCHVVGIVCPVHADRPLIAGERRGADWPAAQEDDARRERERTWATWLAGLELYFVLESDDEREQLAELIADVVADAPLVIRGVLLAELRVDERLRRQAWRRWLDAGSLPELDLARAEHRGRLAARLAEAVQAAPRRGAWGGWIPIRPRAPIAERSDDRLRRDLELLASKSRRAPRMILSYLARSALDLAREGGAKCAEDLVAFGEILQDAETAAPFLPALASRLGQRLDDVRAWIAGESRPAVERALDPHVDCSLGENCGGTDCPPAIAERKRAEEKLGAWSKLVLGADSGGRRHFLDGEPVSCGTGLELQAIAYRSDDYGEYTVPLQQGVGVRYEAELSREDAPATLHGDLGGHEFVTRLEPWMRFRWPGRSRSN